MSLSTPSEVEKKFLALFDEPSLKSNDTKTVRDRRKEFESRLLYRTPTSEIAAKIEAAERVVWIPQAYVLFVRKGTCKNCKSFHECLDIPRLFLQQRKQRRDESNPLMYVPVSSIEYPALPRMKVVSVATVPFCLLCFEGLPCPTNSSNLPQVDTESMIAELEALHPSLLLQELSRVASSFPATTSFRSSTNETEFGGYPSEKEFGLGSERSEEETSATVND